MSTVAEVAAEIIYKPGRFSTNKAVERAYARDRIRRGILANAEREALRVGRSIKCGEWLHHAGDQRYDGCQNDGSTCICECHDPTDTQAVNPGQAR